MGRYWHNQSKINALHFNIPILPHVPSATTSEALNLGMVPGQRLPTTRPTTPLRTFSSLFPWASLHRYRVEGHLLYGPLLSNGSLIIQMSNYGLDHLIIGSRVDVPDLSL